MCTYEEFWRGLSDFFARSTGRGRYKHKGKNRSEACELRRNAGAPEADEELRSRFKVALWMVGVERGEVQIWAGTRTLFMGPARKFLKAICFGRAGF